VQSSSSFFSVSRLARASARRPRRVVAGWVLALMLAVGAIGVLGDATTTDVTLLDNPESKQGTDLLADAGLHDGDAITETIIVRSDSETVDSAAVRAVVEQTAADLRALSDVVIPASVVTYYDVGPGSPQAEALVSPDRRTTLIPATLTGTLDDAIGHADVFLGVIENQGAPGIEVLTVGKLSVSEEQNRIAEEDLLRGETIGMAAAMIILVVVFAALVAAGIPLTLAIVSMGIAVGMTAVVGRVVELSFYVTNIISMIGLAVGIDYALFVVERYREERRRGAPKDDAIANAGGTASKAVLFSGLTVVVALTGMFMLPNTIFRSIALGAILVVIIAVAAVLTLVPAMLGLIGDRIDWPRRRRNGGAAAFSAVARDGEVLHRGFWGRLTRLVMARPLVSVGLVVTLLVSAAVPYADIKTGFSEAESLPAGDVRRGFDILEQEFSAGLLAPVEIVVDGPRTPEVEAGLDRLADALARDPAFGAVTGPTWAEADGQPVGLLTVMLTSHPNSTNAYDAVARLREDLVPAANVPATIMVTGGTATNADFFAQVDTWTPRIFAFVLGLSFLLLLLAFRSVVVPVKAILMNLLSVGAAYGLLVLVFQKGVGADLLGFQPAPTIDARLPLFLFCVLFGLSMDYHVFLLSRIKEHYDRTGRNGESVAVGLQSTARIITGAALIMVAVFAGFASGRLVMIQQMGFGLAVAVFLDATIVRSVLVPASMALLGDRNWYLPKWLGWLPDLRIEGGHSHSNVPDAGARPTGAMVAD
jgi:putative drug exporter of the RND superfamily